MSNYESRLERLEQEIAEPFERRAVVYFHDSNTRSDDWADALEQRFDRGTDESVDAFLRRVLESLGLVERNVIVVHYVGANGNGGLKFPSSDDLSRDQI